MVATKWMAVAALAAGLLFGTGCDEGNEGGYYSGEEEYDDAVVEAEDVSSCVPQCSASECGDDGCGGSCGECGYDEQCSAGKCMSACGACMEGSCGYELKTCEGNYQCGALLQCLSNCGTESCANSCIYSYMGGADDLLALLECVDDYCSSKC